MLKQHVPLSSFVLFEHTLALRLLEISPGPGNEAGGVDGVMDTWALAPSAEREAVAVAAVAADDKFLVPSGHLPSADIVDTALAAIPANMAVL
jgi:hypothetical protein